MFFDKQHSSRNSTTQAVAYNSAAASSNAFGSQTYQVRLAANSACHYAIGASPTATTSDAFMPANSVEYVQVNPGEKISAIRASSAGLVTATDGTLWVTELT